MLKNFAFVFFDLTDFISVTKNNAVNVSPKLSGARRTENKLFVNLACIIQRKPSHSVRQIFVFKKTAPDVSEQALASRSPLFFSSATMTQTYTHGQLGNFLRFKIII